MKANSTPTPSAAPTTLTREVTVLNRYGIHARPAALLVKEATRFASEIFIEKDGIQVNGKSIMGLMALEGHHGAKMKIHAKGPDAAAALEALAALFDRKFFEE